MTESTNTSNSSIIAFCCSYCSYEAADRAGGLRKSYPQELKIIRVPCSGRIDLDHILRALENGAEGVLVLGCHPGDCHFKTGNKRAYSRYLLLKKMLKGAGIDEKRVKFDWISASEDEKFIKVVNDFVDTIKSLNGRK
ncbi:MAG: hydrogenase iron-sulfur subunit [Archaeoglobaceae archaeon]